MLSKVRGRTGQTDRQTERISTAVFLGGSRLTNKSALNNVTLRILTVAEYRIIGAQNPEFAGSDIHIFRALFQSGKYEDET